MRENLQFAPFDRGSSKSGTREFRSIALFGKIMNSDQDKVPESVQSTLDAMHKNHPSRGFAVESSYICFACSIILPLFAVSMTFSGMLPSSRSGSSFVLYIFAFAQFAAIVVGVLSLFRISKCTALGVVIRSGFGIIVGGISGCYIVALAGFAGSRL
jgi:heme/copper-type cytochrome/quinol oxidase subunit 4